MLPSHCSYLVEPIRYRKVVIEILGANSAAAGGPGQAADNTNIALSRDQELAISSAVEAFDKKTAAIWQLRAEALDAVKSCQGRRGSELDNMRSFLKVRAPLACLLVLDRCTLGIAQRS
jgi:hypothetical protein